MTRSRSRSRVRLLGTLAVAACAIAACGGSSTHPRASASVRRPVASGACSNAVAAARSLPSVRTAMVDVGTPPFGVATTRDGRWSFVALAGGGLDLFSDASFTPRLVRSIPLPSSALGVTLTHGGHKLLIADEATGAMVLSIIRRESGARHPLLGTLSASAAQRGPGGAIEVTTSLDDDFAFVSIEYSSEVAVYDLRAGFGPRAFVGVIPARRRRRRPGALARRTLAVRHQRGHRRRPERGARSAACTC